MRFPGQYYDAETGRYYNYFRDYDPGIGRYVESDPIGLDGGVNTFGYAYANPVENADPMGLGVGLWLTCQSTAAFFTAKSYQSVVNVEESPLVDDVLMRIDDRMDACEIGTVEGQDTYNNLKLIRDEHLKAVQAIAENHARKNASNASLIAAAQTAIFSGACALTFLITSPSPY